MPTQAQKYIERSPLKRPHPVHYHSLNLCTEHWSRRLPYKNYFSSEMQEEGETKVPAMKGPDIYYYDRDKELIVVCREPSGKFRAVAYTPQTLLGEFTYWEKPHELPEELASKFFRHALISMEEQSRTPKLYEIFEY